MQITPQQFDQVQQLFLRLRPMSVQQRNMELADEEAIIRTEVLSLLSAHESCGTFLQQDEQASLAEFATPTIELRASSGQDPPKHIGPYRILQKIGEGGHGAVFMAEQTEPIQRKVAVKLVKPGMDSKQVLARFHAERQALTMMDHVSIARVIDAGASDSGSPYFVMELVKGLPIDAFCDQNSLNLNERLYLFLQVCDAVHHAHRKGIIHRDLKPSNVLVAIGEAEPIAKVIDFGIAKALDTRLTEQTLCTEYGQMIGTLEYMSPEQAEMSTVDIDTRSDVYSLGVLLYQLLTGKTPISKDELLRKGLFEIPRLIRETEPKTPSSRITAQHEQVARVDRETSQRGLVDLKRSDLDWITMKALAGDRRRRYDSALDFARDLKRFLNGDPVDAHPPSLAYKLSKYATRHRITAATGMLVLASLLLGVIGLATGLQRAGSALDQAMIERKAASAAQQKAEQSARRLAENMYSDLLESAWKANQKHDNERAIHLLDSCLPELRGWEWNFARNQIREQPHTVLRRAGQTAIGTIDVNVLSKLAACVLEDGNVEIWQLQRNELLQTITGKWQANTARFNANASTLAIGTSKGELLAFQSGDWQQTTSMKLELGAVYDISISGDGKRIAACTGGRWVVVMELESLQSVSQWQLPTRTAQVAFVKGTERLVAAGLDGHIYSMQIGSEEIASRFVSEASLQELTWLDEHTLAALSAGAAVAIDVDELDNPPDPIVRCRGVASAIAAHPTGLVIVGSADGSLVTKYPDADQRVAANFGTAITALGATTEHEFLVGLSDGRLLRVGTDNSAAGWFAASRAPITAEILLPARGLAIVFDEEGWMRAFDIESGELQSEKKAHEKAVWSASCDAKETLLSTVGEDQRLCCWELPSMKLRFNRSIDWGVRDVCVAPDASWIAAAPPASEAIGQQEGSIAIWNARTGQPDKVLTGHDNWVLKLAVTRDGSRLVSACENRNTRVWSVERGESTAVISPLKKSAAEHLAFNRSDSILYLGHRDGWVTSWTINDGEPGPTWSAFGDALTGVAVTTDNRILATSRSSEQLRVHDFTNGQTLAEFDLGLGYLLSFQLSRDEAFISIAGQNRQSLTTRATGWGRE